MNDYPRDLVGYANSPPKVTWPNSARLAIQFVINYEEGGENCVLHGDEASESFLSEMFGAQPYNDQRHMSMESNYEYGSRVGFWRLHKLFTERQLPITVFAVATALQRNPAAAEAMLKSEWEIACHGLKWIHYQNTNIEIERQHMQQAIDIHRQICGGLPLGWYTGRDSPNTKALVLEQKNFIYHSDYYGDDLPFWDSTLQTPLLTIPYTLDVNDMKFASPYGFNNGDQFFTYLKDTFDCLYEEGKETPKMMSIGLHARIIGRPGRIQSLKRFLDYIAQYDAWVCRRDDIARHWMENHPYSI
ncbi:MAG: allantoinase [Oceanicoccus sp.]|jgi:allantoinase